MKWIKTIILSVLLAGPVLLLAEENTAEKPESSPSTKKAASEKYADYLVNQFGEHLKKGDWIARCMAIVSLSKIDDSRITEMLLDTMQKDRKPVVQIFAWEALHARQGLLTDEQRDKWKKAAFRFDDKNLLHGEMRKTLVRLIQEDGLNSRSKKRFMKIFAKTNSLKASDMPTICALGDALWEWGDLVLFRNFINMLSDRTITLAYRAEVMLRQNSEVTKNIKASHEIIKENMETNKRLESSDFMWTHVQKQWKEWYDSNKNSLGKNKPGKLTKYSGVSAIMPLPEKITEENYKKWRGDLEMKAFRLGQLDIEFVVDTTASMGAAVTWLKHDLSTMMLAFKQISREPQVGLTFYRDVGDQYVVQQFPLTDKVTKLVKVLHQEKVAGGGEDLPEAVYAGLSAAINKTNWSKGEGRKIIILLGDAPPKKQNMEKIETLVKKAVSDGFIISTVKVGTPGYFKRGLKDNWDPGLTSFDKIAEWGNGASVKVHFENGGPFMDKKTPLNVFRGVKVAQTNKNLGSERLIFKHVLKACLTEDYRSRVGPFVMILMDFFDEDLKEFRLPFPMHKLTNLPPAKNKQLKR